MNVLLVCSLLVRLMFVRVLPYCSRCSWLVVLGIGLGMFAPSAGAQEKSLGDLTNVNLTDLNLTGGQSEGSATESRTAQDVGIKRVVILYSHRQMSPINKQWHTGIVDGIKQVYRGPIDIEAEYMDVVLQEDKEFFNEWSKVLELKYKKYPPDVVIPVFFPAYTFALVNRDKFFPDCPMVFCGVPKAFAESQIFRRNITGVGGQLDNRPSVEVIQKVLPGTKKLLVLSGKSRLDVWLSSIAINQIKIAFPEIELQKLEGLTPSEAASEMVRAGPDAAGLMLSFELDNHGNRMNTTEFLNELRNEATVPIFGCYDTILGQGILGGALLSPLEFGNTTGLLVGRVLNGESADEIPKDYNHSHTIAFDDEVMRKFGISESRLPAGSRVINRKPSLWNQYGRYLGTGLAALLVQSAIIVSLLLNRAKRIAAQKEAQSLAGRILSAGEEERRYLARELHDDVSQRLAAVSIETGTLENRMNESSEIKDSLGKLKRNLIGICNDLHRMSRHMHPSVLDDFGLSEALRSECSDLSQRWGIPIELHCSKRFPEIPKPVALCLYRVAQESLWNAIRHSGSSKISIELKSDAEFVYMDVSDDGRGFEPSTIQKTRRLGFASMNERIRLVGGTIKTKSAPEQGVTISVVAPIPDASTP
ncbi:MAG: histidine kinase [Planctomycetota bacterium]|nr:histidine kinase [Planctomycetota bacterium]